MVALNLYSVTTDTDPDWYRSVDDTTRPYWYVLQVSLVLGAMVAGFITGTLSPRRVFVPIALVVLAMLSIFVEQIPRPMTWASETLRWTGPCAGLVAGVVLGWRRRTKTV